jgi:hypothetical protein
MMEQWEDTTFQAQCGKSFTGTVWNSDRRHNFTGAKADKWKDDNFSGTDFFSILIHSKNLSQGATKT